jgi:cytochrome o ubiquinol oxidase subunit 2
LIFFLVLAIGLICLWLFVKSHPIAMLEPSGWVAWKERGLMEITTWLMLIVVVPVFVLAAFFVWKYRVGNSKGSHDPNWDHHRVAEILWWCFPFVIIVVLSVVTWKGCRDLDPFRPLASKQKPMTIQVVALDWKWLFIYPEQKIASVNFFQVPEQMPICFEITSDAPMNSFWIPELGGQVFAMSGMRTKLHLVADQEGDFRGCSANISGRGFSGMTFTAKASSQADFDHWVETIRRSSGQLNRPVYQQLAKPSEYHPVATYALQDEGLFDWIVMKYMMPGAE